MQLNLGNEPLLLSKEEMLACAQAEGFVISDSTFNEWVEKGLLGKPKERIWPGQGHGSGSIVKWSPPQRNLFLGLLLQRKYGAPIRALCNLPVWGWLYYEDTVDIALEQVKLVMITWAERYYRMSVENVRKSARHMVTLAASSRAPEIKNKVKKKLMSVGLGDEMPDEELLYLLQELIDPKRRGEAKGPAGASLSADNIYDAIVARSTAAKYSLKNNFLLF